MWNSGSSTSSGLLSGCAPALVNPAEESIFLRCRSFLGEFPTRYRVLYGRARHRWGKLLDLPRLISIKARLAFKEGDCRRIVQPRSALASLSIRYSRTTELCSWINYMKVSSHAAGGRSFSPAQHFPPCCNKCSPKPGRYARPARPALPDQNPASNLHVLDGGVSHVDSRSTRIDCRRRRSKKGKKRQLTSVELDVQTAAVNPA